MQVRFQRNFEKAGYRKILLSSVEGVVQKQTLDFFQHGVKFFVLELEHRIICF